MTNNNLEESLKRHIPKKRMAICTLGCRVNFYESEAMTEKFIKEGYSLVDFQQVADVYVINTCSVTNIGDKKSRQMISRARRLNPEAVIAVVGCYAQISPKEVSLIEGVDVVLGTRNKSEIVYWVNRFNEEGKQIIKVSDVLQNKHFEELNIEEYQDKTRAFLKIQDGCNRFCSYCLIPYARGAVCSKEPEKIIEECKKLAQHGFKEVILSGIHIASYGVDLKDGVDLVTVIEEINSLDGIERIRIGSVEPSFFTEDNIKRLCKCQKLCPHFHLSLQSGCDETLKRMNRRYTTEEYASTVNKLRQYIEDVSVTTDVIVGFPGESQEEFEKTYEFLKKLELTKTHVFKYSIRKGTKAALMENQVESSIKDERSNKLIALNLINEKKYMEKYLNKELPVLFEEKIKEKENIYEGYTPNYIRVLAASHENIKGKILKVLLKDIQSEYMYGKMI
ncbi:threonylcarbamoyladenosine tRNA methylthiotransferase MtaB [Hathewaya proteolytica DSM 3090]|uniref:Threonylcarbamoyladenosine tRNA methylthiotransferase MtaB n=1 Tax=Hathewaya proteolytica DSM 3090 TaxID=1121331 RepID=A0A1M6JGD2_9CLOT|nr:tRNA (N(6)-L-threonylcarbamoyladenosine(37)-C(2))-methylthiotransferase MtaB [Hathewaya proteolytica]SHJ45746.1 threonylcarbamoyladenosine tRNA methylthiotransferase MtaB [Hathewaya proteolytica DSM 3090]